MTEPNITPEDKAATTSLGELLTGVSKDISTLFRQEVELAKAELTESAKKAGKGAGMFGGAGLTALFALLFLSIAAWWGLGFLLNNALSAVVIAAIYAVVALILFLRGKKELRDINGAPKTVDSLKKIPETVKPGGHA
ncbi:phage holin family protein [Frondihabitans sp. VKM Ac-2883]|uniref:phage holin family protein n=1 Tax=Frondihabitans sp. VKM Ac-2883 TaxID=2783823 RepID=UPI00188C915D|nr:phage holin family protein [Frondihabitans sp. VKM Ac-2883]MBF4577576.1 phage holin family protein [Frondihabitans sp. VKM Ac-2883]